MKGDKGVFLCGIGKILCFTSRSPSFTCAKWDWKNDIYYVWIEGTIWMADFWQKQQMLVHSTHVASR